MNVRHALRALWIPLLTLALLQGAGCPPDGTMSGDTGNVVDDGDTTGDTSDGGTSTGDGTDIVDGTSGGDVLRRTVV